MAELTAEQRLALDLDRNLAVTAGAGSGKTLVLVERYLAHLRQGLAPHEILAVTFTCKAASEMRARVLAALGEHEHEAQARARKQAEVASLRQAVSVAPIATLHAFSASLLREFALQSGVDPSFEIAADSERTLVLGEAIDDLLHERAAERVPWLEPLLGLFDRRTLARALVALACRGEQGLRWARSLVRSSDEEVLLRWASLPRRPEPLATDRWRPSIEALRGAASSGPESDRLVAAARAALDGVAALERLSAAAPGAERRRHAAALRRIVLPGGLLQTRSGRPYAFGRMGSRAAFGKASGLIQPAREALGSIVPRLVEEASLVPADLDERALPALRALARLAIELHDRYEERKRARAVLDFDDLIGRALLLLERHEEVRAAVSRRYRAVLVDEFQDIDPLQWRLIEALATGARGGVGQARLFVVGDRKQSIYRFRGADVSVFAAVERRIQSADPAGVIGLRDNFRSRPGLVTFTNHLFARVFARPVEDFEAPQGPLRARRSDSGGPGRIELLLVSARGAGAKGGESDPEAGADAGDTEAEEASLPLDEAELVARLIRARLAEDAARRPQDFAILLRRRTNLQHFEAALRRQRLPFAVHGGVGFHGAPEVVDAVNLLRFLADAREDIALAGVLRSTLGGLTDCALYLVARTEGETLFSKLCRAAEGRAGLEKDDLEAAREAVRTLERLLALADRVPPSELLRRAFEESGAYAAIALGARGRQALANLTKLLDIVRDLDARGFRGLGRLSDALLALAKAESEEPEAPLAEESGDEAAPGAVRILTVHAAKGLEFPVVVVPELGAPARAGFGPALIEEVEPASAGAERAIEVGLKVPDPAQGYALADTALRRFLAKRGRLKDEAEMRRLLYVACTRARDHLVLSGSLARSSGGGGTGPTWLGLVLDALGPEAESSRRVTVSWEGARAEVEIVRPEDLAGFAPSAPPAPRERLLDRMEEDLARVAAEPERHPEVRKGPALPSVRPLLAPSRVKLFKQCPRRYYYAALLRIPESPADLGMMPSSAEAFGQAARLRGLIVHRAIEEGRKLEDAEIERLVSHLAEEFGEVAPGGAGGPPVAGLASIASTVRAALRSLEKSDLGLLLGEAEAVYRERPFVLKLGAGAIEGRIDALVRSKGKVFVIDWKSDEIEASEAESVVESQGYAFQIELYALAAARLLHLDRVEAVIFFTFPAVSVHRSYDRACLDRIAAQAAADLEQISAGAFDRGEHAPCATCGYGSSGLCELASADRSG